MEIADRSRRPIPSRRRRHASGCDPLVPGVGRCALPNPGPSTGRHMEQKSPPKVVRWMLRRTVRPWPPRFAGGHHVGLDLEHLVAERVGQRLLGDAQHAEAGEVVEVCGHPVEVGAARQGADHRQPALDELGPDRPAGAHVDDRLRPLGGEQADDPRLVGGQLVEDARVGGMHLGGEADVGAEPEQLGASGAQRRRRRRDGARGDPGLGRRERGTLRGRAEACSPPSISVIPSSRRPRSRSSSTVASRRSAGVSPSAAALATRRLSCSELSTPHWVMFRAVVRPKRATVGAARSRPSGPGRRLSGWAPLTPGSSFSLIRRSPGGSARRRSRGRRRGGGAATRPARSRCAASPRSRAAAARRPDRR